MAFFGGIERKVEGKFFQGGNITALFGGFKIDLTRAEMEGDEAVIYVNAVFGGGEIIAPESWRVSVEGAGIFGGYVDKTRYGPRPDGVIKTLHVRGAAVFGGIEVKSW
jgi:predicted membrane protein